VLEIGLIASVSYLWEAYLGKDSFNYAHL
jgi:hypothetical protein